MALHRANRLNGILRFEQPQQFLANAFAGKNAQAFTLCLGGAERRLVDVTFSVPGVKTKEPEDAQIVFADALDRAADKTRVAARCRQRRHDGTHFLRVHPPFAGRIEPCLHQGESETESRSRKFTRMAAVAPQMVWPRQAKA